MNIVFFKGHDGFVPVRYWLDGEVARRDIRIAAKCRVRIALLKEHGNALRRPFADYLRDGVYELRIAYGTVNYRILYFFHKDSEAIVLAHGITKEAKVANKDIELALQRKSMFESDRKGMHTMKQDKNRITDAVEILDRQYGNDTEWDRLVAEEELKAGVGQLVHDLRMESGLSQTKLAELAGTSQSIISRVENADYEGSALEILARVCFALHRNIRVDRKKDGPVAIAC